MFDVVLLSRLQFAVATLFHFLFVPLTLGLSLLVAIYETLYVKTGDEDYKRAAKFWGKLFLINFAVGVVTGITLEFQFGTNWSRYSMYVGDIFGSLLAIEATLAFFLESTFIAVWHFGWNRLSPKLHAICIWLVAIAGNISALWILLANGWMQHPVGYVLRNNRAELESFWAVITNPFGWLEFFHTTAAAYVLAGFFVLGISAWHLIRKNEVTFFKKSFRVAAIWTLVFSIFLVINGDIHGSHVAHTQPTKLAAMESIWETQRGAPLYLLVIPDEANERNKIELLPIPKFLSFISYHDLNAEVKGLKEWPKEERPPVALTFWSFRAMIGLGLLFLFMSIWAFVKRLNPETDRKLLRILPWIIPLPYLGCELGWIVAEVGRQPWIVYGLMKTTEAVSPVAPVQVAISLIAFTLVYTFLGLIGFYLIFKFARRGPKAKETKVIEITSAEPITT
ncbi:cytochrome bd ubiquinol oxidase subunit I [Thermodesulfatator indicus DSM 15286]|uniref:Cytochrome bd ubiquinol oxidase subunit I n=1 Tax=Thermodesulfatator indicus (strain DSM 15286 / JCM 11887 / CIR29812) TaxID=667014 RepID=F8ACK2_THEID|nr:cytochrome ubiquinol oxidase subunit I [Thermodesulfatator indicus]AEH44707.1 cytochrome bd ubiquinol oxidase subunit I [Thermodesulfatator indicus DSM 15286]